MSETFEGELWAHCPVCKTLYLGLQCDTLLCPCPLRARRIEDATALDLQPWDLKRLRGETLTAEEEEARRNHPWRLTTPDGKAPKPVECETQLAHKVVRLNER